jgi:predicted kinase
LPFRVSEDRLAVVILGQQFVKEEVVLKGIIFVGLQASGKSTYFLRNFHKTYLRLSMDMLRTRHREKILFNACLEAKQAVVIDNTNPTKEGRAKYIVAFKASKFEIVGYYFASAVQDCLDRNSLRLGKERVPDAGVLSTYNKLEIPDYAEGFDKLYYVAMKNGEFTVSEWKDEI